MKETDYYSALFFLSLLQSSSHLQSVRAALIILLADRVSFPLKGATFINNILDNRNTTLMAAKQRVFTQRASPRGAELRAEAAVGLI